MKPFLAHAGGVDEAVTTGLLLLAGLAGWFAFSRLRGSGFTSLSKGWAWVGLGVSVTSFILAFVIPPRLAPLPSAVRPGTQASLEIMSPAPRQTFRGDPAVVDVRLALDGARLVPFTSSRLSPEEGHVHLYLNGSLVSMTEGLTQRVEVPPGDHTIVATFVAVDHGPFVPPVSASVSFRVAG
jgi:hypothetical protein